MVKGISPILYSQTLLYWHCIVMDSFQSLSRGNFSQLFSVYLTGLSGHSVNMDTFYGSPNVHINIKGLTVLPFWISFWYHGALFISSNHSKWCTFLEIWNFLNVTLHSMATNGLHNTHISQMPTFWLLTTEEEKFKNCDHLSADW